MSRRARILQQRRESQHASVYLSFINIVLLLGLVGLTIEMIRR